MPTVALMTDLWPSRSEPHSGRFVYAEVAAVGDRFRHVVLVPRLLAASVHRRVWGDAVQGWQTGHLPPAAPHRLVRYPMVRVPKSGEALARARGARAALALTRERAALVHGHFLLHVGPAAVRMARRLGVPSVVTVHGTDARWLLEGGVQQRLREEMRWACTTADRVIAVSNPIADGLRSLGVAPERLDVIPMGADPSIFRIRDRDDVRRQLGLDHDADVVLFVGRLADAKGARVLEEALRLLAPRGKRIECVAAGPADRVPTGIRTLGALDPETLALWMGAADLVCLPSYAEGSPVSVVEALASGTPVVASAVGAVPEQVRDGETGLLVPAGEPERLAAALAQALDSDWPAEELRESSRRYWWPNLADRIVAVYEAALS